MFLNTMINLKNVIKLFVSLREKCPNTKVFLVRIFLYSDEMRRFTVFFPPSISNLMSWIVSSVDISGVVGGKQRERLASNNHC